MRNQFVSNFFVLSIVVIVLTMISMVELNSHPMRNASVAGANIKLYNLIFQIFICNLKIRVIYFLYILVW
jgi:hypothetical protein